MTQPILPRDFRVEPWECTRLRQAVRRKRLDASPPYQRKGVWSQANKAKLIESIVLRYPLGALVVLKTLNKLGDANFAVIDGKQRVSAITEFYDGKVGLSPQVIRRMAAYGSFSELVKKAAITAKSEGPFLWSDMTRAFQDRFDSYVLPVVELQGSILDAQEAFERMNATVYRLVDQEIRNAVFSGYPVLASCKRLAEDRWPGFAENPLLAWGFISKTDIKRMRDVELYSELLHLLHTGPQNVRRNLSGFYRSFPPTDLTAASEVGVVEEKLRKVFRQMTTIFGVVDFQQWGFRKNQEDLYAVVGALKRSDINQPQMNRFHEDLRSALSAFMESIDDVISVLAKGQQPSEEDADESVRVYAGTYLKGQKNSDKRRKLREEILFSIITIIVGTKDPKRAFSEYEKRQIWRRSTDKKCVTCGKSVEWKNFEAGHAKDHALSGPTVVENGILQCRNCNRRTGAQLRGTKTAGSSRATATKPDASGADPSSEVENGPTGGGAGGD